MIWPGPTSPTATPFPKAAFDILALADINNAEMKFKNITVILHTSRLGINLVFHLGFVRHYLLKTLKLMFVFYFK